MSIADSYDGFLIDLDGVVWLGHEPIPGAIGTLTALRDANKPFVFVTNSPRLAPDRMAGVLREAGIPAAERQIVTAGTTLIGLIEERLEPGATLLVTGTRSFRDQVEASGFGLLATDEWQKAAGVLVTGHVHFNYDELRACSMAARSGALFAATARDPTMPMPDGLWPGTGAVLAAIETASDRRAEVTGKPAATIFRSALKRLGLPTDSSVAMIGDRLDTDVGGAQAAGIDGILVAGNESSPATTNSEIVPQHRIQLLSGLIE